MMAVSKSGSVGVWSSADTAPMRAALALAYQAETSGEVPVGAVVLDDQRRTLGAAHNRVELDQDPTGHAEILAIRQACSALGSKNLSSCDLYVTLEPCAMCAQAIAFARIRRVFFAAYDPKGGGIEHGAQIFDQATCHHRPEVIGGVCEEEASALLRRFFKNLREFE